MMDLLAGGIIIGGLLILIFLEILILKALYVLISGS